jgi:hypothetical protein
MTPRSFAALRKSVDADVYGQSHVRRRQRQASFEVEVRPDVVPLRFKSILLASLGGHERKPPKEFEEALFGFPEVEKQPRMEHDFEGAFGTEQAGSNADLLARNQLRLVVAFGQPADGRILSSSGL